MDLGNNHVPIRRRRFPKAPPKPEESTSSSTDLLFVNNSDGSKPREGVRSHVMKNYRRKQRENIPGEDGAAGSQPQPSRRGIGKMLPPHIKSHSSHLDRNKPTSRQPSVPSQASSQASSMIVSSFKSTIITPFDPRLRGSTYGQPLLIQDNGDFSNNDGQLVRMTNVTSPGKARIFSHSPVSSIKHIANSEPFDSFPVPFQPYTHQLIHHFSEGLAPMLLPIDASGSHNPFRQYVMSLAMSDAMLFHATISISALHIFLQSPEKTVIKSMSPEGSRYSAAMFHKGEAMNMLAIRLSADNPDINDATIRTVLTLAAFETLNGNVSEFHETMRVLKDMVDRRGGLRGLGTLSPLPQMINWADMIGAAITSSKPYFEPIELLQENPTNARITEINSTSPLRSHASLLSTKMLTSPIFRGRDDLCSITTSLHHLTTHLETSLTHPATEHDNYTFSHHRASIEYRLISATAGGILMKPADDHRHIQEAWRLAALLYVNKVLRKLPSSAAAVKLLLDLLKGAVERSNVKERWHCHGDMFLWVCFLGCFAAMTEVHKRFFDGLLVGTIKEMGLRSSGETQRVLEGVLWPRSVFEGSYRGIWEAIKRNEMRVSSLPVRDGTAAVQ